MKIILTGDLAPIRAFAGPAEKNPESLYGDLLPRLRGADFRIVNLESPLCDGEYIVKSGAAFSGAPSAAGLLTAVPFDAVCCANNHAFDCGDNGFFATRQLLEAQNIRVFGAGADQSEAEKPLVWEADGIRTAVFAVSEGEDLRGAAPGRAGTAPWDPERTAAAIRRARGDYDLILALVHGGLEYIPFPPPYLYDAFTLLADAGADLVAGHHPHVPQGMALKDGTPLYFSLGNFIFYQPTRLYYRKIGCLLELEVDRSGLKSHRPIPYMIDDSGVRSLAEAEFAPLFNRLSAPLVNREGAETMWRGFLAWYGEAGFRDELDRIRAAWDKSAAKGAAMLRNRVTAMQHRSHWVDGLTRIADGVIDRADPAAVEFARDYFTRETRQS